MQHYDAGLQICGRCCICDEKVGVVLARALPGILQLSSWNSLKGYGLSSTVMIELRVLRCSLLCGVTGAPHAEWRKSG